MVDTPVTPSIYLYADFAAGKYILKDRPCNFEDIIVQATPDPPSIPPGEVALGGEGLICDSYGPGTVFEDPPSIPAWTNAAVEAIEESWLEGLQMTGIIQWSYLVNLIPGGSGNGFAFAILNEGPPGFFTTFSFLDDEDEGDLFSPQGDLHFPVSGVPNANRLAFNLIAPQTWRMSANGSGNQVAAFPGPSNNVGGYPIFGFTNLAQAAISFVGIYGFVYNPQSVSTPNGPQPLPPSQTSIGYSQNGPATPTPLPCVPCCHTAAPCMCEPPGPAAS
jgi:hypothetical protein